MSGCSIRSTTTRFELRSRIRQAVLRLFQALAASLYLLAPAGTAAETKNVLVLYSNSRLLPAIIAIERGLQEAIKQSTHHVELGGLPITRADPTVHNGMATPPEFRASLLQTDAMARPTNPEAQTPQLFNWRLR
jgi:hypothetical protein